MQSLEITCPISKQIFFEPVVASDGFVYEKECIEHWLSTRQSSPITNLPLENNNINDLQFMKTLVAEKIKQNPELKKDQYVPILSKKKLYKQIVKCADYNKLLECKEIDLHELISLIDDNGLCSNFFKRNTKIIKHIINNCIDINIVIMEGWRLIHYITYFSKPDLIKYIVKKGADLEVVTNCGSKPIHFVVDKSTDKIINLFIKKGVDINAITRSGMTPLHIACKQNTIESIKLLIDNGAKIDIDTIENVHSLDYILCNKNIIKNLTNKKEIFQTIIKSIISPSIN